MHRHDRSLKKKGPGPNSETPNGECKSQSWIVKNETYLKKNKKNCLEGYEGPKLDLTKVSKPFKGFGYFFKMSTDLY